MHTAIFCTFVVFAVLQSFTNAEVLTFTDTQQFIDLSTYNFYLGRNYVYEHTLVARPGKQVNLYLFTNNVNQYSIHVYNGDNDQAPELPTQAFIPKNELAFEYPDPIKSTGEKMFVRIVPFTTDLKVQLDFQAMATDYTQEGCEKLVISAIPNPIVTTVPSISNKQGGNCYYVMHANDVTNSPLLTQAVQSGFNRNYTKYNIYKGLYTDEEHALVNTGQWWNLHASDKYLIINPIEDIAFGYYWHISNYITTTYVNLFTHESLMTFDYLQDEYPNMQGQFQQDFIVRMNEPVTAVQITYLSLSGAGALKVTTFNDTTKTAEPITYFATDFTGPFNVTYANCDSVELQYTIQNRQVAVKSGFYGLITDATLFPIDVQSTPSTPAVTGKVQPIQTTTPKSGKVSIFSIVLVLTIIALLFA